MWYFTEYLKRWKDFSGVTGRKIYWTIFAINFVLGIVLFYYVSEGVYYAFTIGVIVPSIAIGIRRLRDAGKSPWWFICPIVGPIFLAFPTRNEKGL